MPFGRLDFIQFENAGWEYTLFEQLSSRGLSLGAPFPAVPAGIVVRKVDAAAGRVKACADDELSALSDWSSVLDVRSNLSFPPVATGR